MTQTSSLCIPNPEQDATVDLLAGLVQLIASMSCQVMMHAWMGREAQLVALYPARHVSRFFVARLATSTVDWKLGDEVP